MFSSFFSKILAGLVNDLLGKVYGFISKQISMLWERIKYRKASKEVVEELNELKKKADQELKENGEVSGETKQKIRWVTRKLTRDSFDS